MRKLHHKNRSVDQLQPQRHQLQRSQTRQNSDRGSLWNLLEKTSQHLHLGL